MATHHTLYAVDIDDVLIDQITDYGLDPGVQNILLGGDGQPYSAYAAALRIAPVISFTTTALATALGKIGSTGLQITTGAVVTMYFQKLAEGGARAGASSHLKLVANEGLCIPRTLTADESGARLAYDILCTYDGTNAPLVLTASQSLAGSPTVDEAYVVGPVKINNVQLESIVGLTLDFGLQTIAPAGDGNVYPEEIYIASVAPVLTVRTLDALALNTLGLGGAAQGATQSEFYLRALSQGGARAANNASSHIKILNTASKGKIDVQAVRGAHNEILAADISVALASSGAAHPLSITTATTIPTGL